MTMLVLWNSVAFLLAAGVASADSAYGVNVPETGDVKAHRQIAAPDGRIEGEYRWLQPNGLYRVTRYFVDGDSGYHAFVSEEPGEPVENFYTNTHDRFPGTSSHINNNGQPDNINQEFSVSSGRNNLHLGNRFQKTPNTAGQNNEILSDVTIVGENTKLTSNSLPTSQRFKRTSPLFNGEFNPFSSGSFSRSSSSSFGSNSKSQSSSRAKSSGSGGTSSSESFSSSSSGSSGSKSSSESFSSSGTFFPQFFSRNKRSPKPQSFSQASSKAFAGNGQAQSSSQSFSGGQGFGAGSESFSKAFGGSSGNGFGAQSSSGSSSRGGFNNGFGEPGHFGSFSESSAGAGGFNNGFGRPGGSGSFSESSAGAGGFNNGFGRPGGSGSFSRSSAGAGGFNNGYGQPGGFGSFSRSSAGSYGK